MSDNISNFMPQSPNCKSDEWTALQCVTFALAQCKSNKWKQAIIVYVDENDMIATMQATPSITDTVGLLTRAAYMQCKVGSE